MVPDGRGPAAGGPGTLRAGRRGRLFGRWRRDGTSPVTGIAHRNERAVAPVVAALGGRPGGGRRAASFGADGHPVASNPTTTVPSRSVRRTRAPDAASRSRVDFAGWPYGLPAPADATATAGRVASTKACVVAVRLP